MICSLLRRKFCYHGFFCHEYSLLIFPKLRYTCVRIYVHNIYMYIHTYMHMQTHMHVHTYTHTHTHTHMHKDTSYMQTHTMYMHTYTHRICTHTCTHTDGICMLGLKCMCVCCDMCLCSYVCMCMCVYACICVHIHVLTHTHMHTPQTCMYTHVRVPGFLKLLWFAYRYVCMSALDGINNQWHDLVSHRPCDWLNKFYGFLLFSLLYNYYDTCHQ